MSSNDLMQSSSELVNFCETIITEMKNLQNLYGKIEIIKKNTQMMTLNYFDEKHLEPEIVDAIMNLIKSKLVKISYKQEYEGDKIYAHQFLFMPEDIQLRFLEFCDDEKFLHKMLIEALGGMVEVYFRVAEAILNKNILKCDLYEEVKSLQECGRLSCAVWLFQRAILIQKPTEENLRFGFDKCVYELMKNAALRPNFLKPDDKTFNEWMEN